MKNFEGFLPREGASFWTFEELMQAYLWVHLSSDLRTVLEAESQGTKLYYTHLRGHRLTNFL